MALPSLVMPASLPGWVFAGYAEEEAALYAHAPMSTGHSRCRRRWSVSDRLLSASLILTADQVKVFHDWHENDLMAGVVPFAAKVAQMGPGFVWFDALLLKYESTPEAGGITTIDCSLLLRGDPSPTPP